MATPGTLSCDYQAPSPCVTPLPELGYDVDYLASVGACYESIASLTARIGKPVPYWDTCTASVVVNPLDNLRNQVVIQELDSRVAANSVRPTTCVTRSNTGPDGSGDGGDDPSATLSCRSLLCGSGNGSTVATLIRGPLNNTPRSTVRLSCRASSCGDAYGWINAGPSTLDSTWATGPTAAINGTSRQGCGLLGQGGFRY